jgi:integrase
MTARRSVGRTHGGDWLFIGHDGGILHGFAVGEVLRRLFGAAGLRRGRGRKGPRPYDFRHTFAVHRLTRWYRAKEDLPARLPWLSAYMGHVDLLGTETYLNATPELLALASSRFRRRYRAQESVP